MWKRNRKKILVCFMIVTMIINALSTDNIKVLCAYNDSKVNYNGSSHESIYKIGNKQQKQEQRMLKKEAGEFRSWRCVWHGSYPQSEVEKDSALHDVLDSLGASAWNEDGDTEYQGKKYHRMKGLEAFHVFGEEPEHYQAFYYNWEGDYTSYHYFLYEPIKWRILTISDGKALILSEKILDVMDYSSDGSIPEWSQSLLYQYIHQKMDEAYEIPTYE